MKRHSYRERDYAFGQAMLSLRTSLGLTQAGLADLLRVSRHAVGGWEAGSSYPKAPHLQHFIVLAVQQHVFAPEQEEEEIRALWKTARQRVLLDETWLRALLSTHTTLVFTSTTEVRATPGQTPAMESATFPRIDWVGALLPGASLQDSVFTEPFDAITAIAISSTGQYWAAATWRGEVRVWAEAGQTLHQVWQAHIITGIRGLTEAQKASLRALEAFEETSVGK